MTITIEAYWDTFGDICEAQGLSQGAWLGNKAALSAMLDALPLTQAQVAQVWLALYAAIRERDPAVTDHGRAAA